MGRQGDLPGAEEKTRSRARQGTKRAERDPRARLRVVHPVAVRGAVPLARGEVVFGRQPDEGDAGKIADSTVSRRHFAVRWDEALGAFFGRDLESRNGSWVEGARAGEPRALTPNSVVRLGDVIMVFESGPGLAEADADVAPDTVPGDSPSARALRGGVARAGADPSPVLIIGETGTGKEAIARELHRLSGRRGELIAVNCAALNPQLVESQLFGHAKGAFTGAGDAQPGLFRAAHQGTLFLDEIGELPLPLQPKLLRVIQEGEVQPVGTARAVDVDVRIIAATNRDLASDVESGAFRRDLYARLALWELRVPPLRERKGDLFQWIEILERAWRAERGDADPSPRLVFDADAAETLLLYRWKENLRGLDRMVHALADAHRDGVVGMADLPEWLREAAGKGTSTARRSGAESAPPAAQPTTPKPAIPSREELEVVLKQTNGSVRATAKHFRRDRRQIYRWLESFGIPRPKGDD